jgi:hypothetical protein
MIRNRFAFTQALMLLGFLLAACGQASVEAVAEQPAVVEEIEGTELARITLTEKAATRLDIQTASVAEERVNGENRLVIPHGAVLWDSSGAAWAYTSPEELVFVRASITIDHIDGDLAVLSDGPEPGTLVVTVGVAELWGTETGVGGGGH